MVLLGHFDRLVPNHKFWQNIKIEKTENFLQADVLPARRCPQGWVLFAKVAIDEVDIAIENFVNFTFSVQRPDFIPPFKLIYIMASASPIKARSLDSITSVFATDVPLEFVTVAVCTVCATVGRASLNFELMVCHTWETYWIFQLVRLMDTRSAS